MPSVRLRSIELRGAAGGAVRSWAARAGAGRGAESRCRRFAWGRAHCRRLDAVAGGDLGQMKSQLSVIAGSEGRLARTRRRTGCSSDGCRAVRVPRTAAEDTDILVDAFGQLAEHAEAKGV